MRTLRSLFPFIIALLVFAGCTDNNELLSNSNESGLESINDSSIEIDGVVYAMKAKGIASRAESLITNWENFERITLASGTSVLTPWANGASGDIPADVMRDIHANDGWELLAHTMGDKGERGSNYLIFHNYVTGVLKVFYYLEDYQTNNMGIWTLQFDGGTQKFLNFSEQVADPLCYNNSRNAISVTNLTEKSSKGFSAGWNCFQAELAYDPAPLCTTMRISANNYNVQSVDLSGEYNSATEGMLISHSTSNPFSQAASGIANLVGKSADNWFKSKFGKNITGNTESRGVLGGIIGAGAKLLLNSLVSRFDKQENTVQDIQLKTHGTIAMKGSIAMDNPSPVKSVTLQMNALGSLGAWNIENWPIVKVYQHGYLDHISGDDYYYRVTDSWNYCSVIMNPKLKAKAVRVESPCNLIEYRAGAPKCAYNDSSFDRGDVGKMVEHLGGMGTLLHEDDNVSMYLRKSLNGSFIVIKMNNYIPSLGGVPQESDMFHFDIESGFGNPNRFMKISLDCDISINGKQNSITNTKTFLPKYEWNYKS